MGEISFWYRPTRVVPDQRPLNGRCCCFVPYMCDVKQSHESPLINGVWIQTMYKRVLMFHSDFAGRSVSTGFYSYLKPFFLPIFNLCMIDICNQSYSVVL